MHQEGTICPRGPQVVQGEPDSSGISQIMPPDN